jgi:hypothetical protein
MKCSSSIIVPVNTNTPKRDILFRIRRETVTGLHLTRHTQTYIHVAYYYTRHPGVPPIPSRGGLEVTISADFHGRWKNTRRR